MVVAIQIEETQQEEEDGPQRVCLTIVEGCSGATMEVLQNNEEVNDTRNSHEIKHENRKT